MSRSVGRKRPWLAAALATLFTGLGHCYLRRWRRALGWIAGAVAVAVLFVDPGALEALATGGTVDPVAVAPVFVLGGLSAVDAYLLAHVQNAAVRLSAATEGQRTHCPTCGKELDPMLEFCHWCTTELEDANVASSDDGDA
ncbi:hypothetical protein GCM10028857_27260 [Salinarchaeum chitinilyticum]